MLGTSGPLRLLTHARFFEGRKGLAGRGGSSMKLLQVVLLFFIVFIDLQGVGGFCKPLLKRMSGEGGCERVVVSVGGGGEGVGE